MTSFTPHTNTPIALEHSDTCGLFGKLPQQGDFVSHFLPSAFTELWHPWLQTCMGVSKEQLEHTWLDFYLSAPIWRFSLMPGIAHEKAVSGVVLPSVDEVGRYFPLTIVTLQNHLPWVAYQHGNTWFEQLESTACLALEENVNYSDFMGTFELLPLLEVPHSNTYHTEHCPHIRAANLAIPITEANQGDQITVDLLHHAYLQLFGQYGLWWTEGSEHIPPTTLVNSGLPDAGQFAAMLDGNWVQWGWNKTSILTDQRKP